MVCLIDKQEACPFLLERIDQHVAFHSQRLRADIGKWVPYLAQQTTNELADRWPLGKSNRERAVSRLKQVGPRQRAAKISDQGRLS
ncbi:hypothetical protein D3C85_1578040 [compost metagenome]